VSDQQKQKRAASPGGFKKGHDPRRHLKGPTKGPRNEAKARKLEKFLGDISKLDENASKMFEVGFSGIDPNGGEPVPWTSRVKLFEIWLERRFGRVPNPDVGGRTMINLSADNVKSLNIVEASKLLQQLDGGVENPQDINDPDAGVTLDG